jgi:hypothetical protein
MPNARDPNVAAQEWLNRFNDFNRNRAAAQLRVEPNPAGEQVVWDMEEAELRIRDMPRPARVVQAGLNWEVVADGNQGVNPAPLNQNFKYGPELWDQLLEGVREIYNPDFAVVAGGAVRDHLLKVPPKDVDIFMFQPKVPDQKIQDFIDMAQCLGWQNVHLLEQPGQYGNKATKMVLQGFTLGHTIELIVVPEDTVEKVLNNFDFGICQCWYDGEIHTTKAADFDLKKKQWTPLKNMDDSLKARFDLVNNRLRGIFKLNVNQEPWYAKFAGKEKVQ